MLRGSALESCPLAVSSQARPLHSYLSSRGLAFSRACFSPAALSTFRPTVITGVVAGAAHRAAYLAAGCGGEGEGATVSVPRQTQADLGPSRASRRQPQQAGRPDALEDCRGSCKLDGRFLEADLGYRFDTIHLAGNLALVSIELLKSLPWFLLVSSFSFI